MSYNFENIIEQAELALKGVKGRVDFENIKGTFLGSSGKLKSLMKMLSSASQEEKPVLGQAINKCKTQIEEIFAKKLSIIENSETTQSLGEKIDPTIEVPPLGGIHPLSKVQETMVGIFRKIGFTVALGTEIETNWFCYDALNMPDSHPARDTHDSFFLEDDLILKNVSRHNQENYILRSHTSTVQIRTMLTENPPLRIISPGRTFRRDSLDATHSSNFHQCEGLMVDQQVSVLDLRAVLDFFFKELFGSKCETRFRPSFFPFTEPSFEVDFCAPNIGKLSNRWIEVAGCGIVDPNVFSAVGYDPEEWSGYAFGFGIERLAMLMYGVDDIRLFYQNDTRFLKQFQ